MTTSVDLLRYRGEFPVCREWVYLDHAGLAPTSTRVRHAVTSWLDRFVERGILDEDLWEAEAEACRARFARLIHASADEIAFVRNTSHGLSLVAEGLDWRPGDRIAVATDVEYPSNVYPWQHLASRGVEIDKIPAEDGAVSAEAVRAVVRPETRLVAVSSAQYATGTVTDLEALGEVCQRHGLLFCVDGIQTLGALDIDVEKAGVSFLAADSHKWLLGMPGIGVLYVSRKALDRVRPVLVGWKSTTEGWNFDRPHFELLASARKFEEGSSPYALIYGLHAALGLLEEVGISVIERRIRALVEGLADGLSRVGAEIGPAPGVRRHILTFVHPACESGDLLNRLTEQAFVLSRRRGRLRLSPHFYNTEEEMDRFVSAVRDIVSDSV